MRALVLISLLALNSSCAKKTQLIEVPTLPVENVKRCDYRSGEGHSYETVQKWSPLSADQAHKLAGWIKHKAGWAECRETYAPWLVFRGRSFNLNVMSNSAVLNYSETGDKWVQVCVELQSKDIDLLRSLKD
jgi:hypothetical protein